MRKFFSEIDKEFLALFLFMSLGTTLVFIGVILYAGLGPALITLGAFVCLWVVAWMMANS